MQGKDQFEDIYVHKQTLGCVVDGHCVVCWHKIFPVGRLPCQFNRQVPPNQRPEMCARYRARASQAEMNALPSGKCVGIYLKRNQILTVGDGDFSFSLALMSERNKLKLKLTATSHESFETVTTVYPNCNEILKSLKSLGATVLHTVDATNLASCKSIALNSFDTVVWNFPCIKGETASADGQYSEIELNRNMLRLFFVNVQPYLRKDGKREIHVTHKTIEPFCWWNIVDLAKSCGLTFCGSVVFDRVLYPGYTNRKVLDKKSFPSNDAQPIVAHVLSAPDRSSSSPLRQTYIFRADNTSSPTVDVSVPKKSPSLQAQTSGSAADPSVGSGGAVGGVLGAHPFLALLSADATWGCLSAHARAHFKQRDAERDVDGRENARRSEEPIEPNVDSSRENVAATKGKKRKVGGDGDPGTAAEEGREWPASDASQGEGDNGDRKGAQRSSKVKKRKKAKKITTMDGEDSYSSTSQKEIVQTGSSPRQSNGQV